MFNHVFEAAIHVLWICAIHWFGFMLSYVVKITIVSWNCNFACIVHSLMFHWLSKSSIRIFFMEYHCCCHYLLIPTICRSHECLHFNRSGLTHKYLRIGLLLSLWFSSVIVLPGNTEYWRYKGFSSCYLGSFFIQSPGIASFSSADCFDCQLGNGPHKKGPLSWQNNNHSLLQVGAGSWNRDSNDLLWRW